MKITDLIPDRIKAIINGTLDLLDRLLQGETVLLIGNVAGIAIYAVAKGLGSIPDVSFTDALAQAVAAIAVLNGVLLTIRHYVYSPATVAKIVLTPPTSAGPVSAAIEAGAGSAINTELDKQEPSA